MDLRTIVKRIQANNQICLDTLHNGPQIHIFYAKTWLWVPAWSQAKLATHDVTIKIMTWRRAREMLRDGGKLKFH